MAEFLIRAENHWTEALTPEQRAERGITDEAFNARGEKGDIVVVMPDGHPWGREECLPKFIIIKAPTITIAQTKFLECNLSALNIDNENVMKKRRQFRVPSAIVDEIIAQGGVLTITKKILDNIKARVKKRYINISGEIVETDLTDGDFA